jgi:serine/threonine-protein kinase PRP4
MSIHFPSKLDSIKSVPFSQIEPSLFAEADKKAGAVYVSFQEEDGRRTLELKENKNIGKGTYGTVFLAETSDNKKYAVKVSNHSNQEKLECYMWHEAKVLSYLSEDPHPGIIRFFGFGLVGNKRSVLLELKKENLRSMLEKSEGLSTKRIRNITKQLVEALEYLKSKKIIHADIKQENVLLDRGDRVCLGDFDAAFEVCRRKGNTYMTLWFIPPEGVVQTGFHGFSADVWSLACVVFALVTKEHLFPVETQVDRLRRGIQFRGNLIPLHEASTGSKYPKELLDRASFSGRCLYDPSSIPDERYRALQEGYTTPIEEMGTVMSPRKERMEKPFLENNPGQTEELDGLDGLLERMFEHDPKKRITSKLMLEHPFLQSNYKRDLDEKSDFERRKRTGCAGK